MDYPVIDFHTHPFFRSEDNICRYKDHWAMGPDTVVSDLAGAGIDRFCGSVIRTREGVAAQLGVKPADLSWWDVVHGCNEDMLELRERLGEAYVPGMMVHPDFVPQSLAEMEALHSRGVALVGELVPYYHGWEDYSRPDFGKLLDAAADLGMAVSIHSMGEDAMDAMAAAHPNTTLVFAHPGEHEAVCRHIRRLKRSPNFHLDLAGTGLFRHGVLRALIDEVGPEKILFGTDYPVCNPYMYLSGVTLDPKITDGEKRLILHDNAQRVLHLP